MSDYLTSVPRAVVPPVRRLPVETIYERLEVSAAYLAAMGARGDLPDDDADRLYAEEWDRRCRVAAFFAELERGAR